MTGAKVTSMNFRIFLLVAAGLLSSCGESKPPAGTPTPPSSPASSETGSPAPADPGSAPKGGQPSAEQQSPKAASAPAEQPKNLAARKLATEKIRNGEDVYQKNCANCHGLNGEAKPDWRTPGPDGRYPPPPLDGSAHAWHHSTETLEKMIREGSQDGAMPAWEGKLTNQQIENVVVWIKSLWPDEIYDIWLKEIEPKPESK